VEVNMTKADLLGYDDVIPVTCARCGVVFGVDDSVDRVPKVCYSKPECDARIAAQTAEIEFEL
jgi:hypothetical protein